MLQCSSQAENPSAKPGRSCFSPRLSLCSSKTSAVESSTPNLVPRSSPRASLDFGASVRNSTRQARRMDSLGARGSRARQAALTRADGQAGKLGSRGKEGVSSSDRQARTCNALIANAMRRYSYTAQHAVATGCRPIRGEPAHPHRGRLGLASPSVTAQQEPHP